jgi:hypothetical protein
MLPSKEWKPVDVCICGASAGLLCGSGCGLYAWFKAVPFTTIQWLAFVGVTAVAGAILSLAGLQLWNWIGRGPRRTRRKGDPGVPREAQGGPDGQQQGMSRENCRLW